MAGKDLTDLEADVRALRARVEAQAAEIEELRGARPNRDQPVSRRHLLAGLAGLGAAGVASVATAEPAAAADGDALLLGTDNQASVRTSLNVPDDYSGVAIGVTGGAFGLEIDSAAAGIIVRAGGPDHGFGAILASGAGPASGIDVSADNAAAVVIRPAGRVGPPTIAGSVAGSISVDAANELWLCVQDGEPGVPGTPGTWTRLLREDTTAGRVIPITPARVLDTRSLGGRTSGGPLVPGQTQGPIAHLQTLTLDLAGVAPIPAAAKGVVGNATIVTPSGGGYLRVYPAGTSVLTSTVNFAKGSITANGFTCALSATGLSTRASIVGAGTYHLVLDITAYIT
ncbi:MAG: hypothetical protein ACOYXM_09470 [Actinomycetota bacterium]